MGTATYSVPGVSCGHCEAAITEEVAPIHLILPWLRKVAGG